MPNYTPRNWYWLAEDGRLFSSAAPGLVAADDADYVRWAAAGGVPTPWPRDEDGEQTQAALREVLAPYGIFIDLAAYAADRRWRRETAGVTVMIGGESVLVSTSRGDDRSALHMTYSALKDGLRADGAVFNFVDGRPRKVSNADMEAAVLAALDHVQDAFDLGEIVYAAILAGEITSTAEIDAAFA